VFMSNRDKGLTEADAVLGERCIRAYCCKHIEGNFKDAFGAKDGLCALFWRVARARVPATFEYWMEKIAAVKPEATEYLRAIDLTLWATAHFPGTRYGHLTSNIAESVNKVLREDRVLSITELLDAIWHRVMEERSSRLTEAHRQLADGVKYTSYCQTKLMEGRKWAQGNHVSYTFYNRSIANYSIGSTLKSNRGSSCPS
jgi:hypothetical protein